MSQITLNPAMLPQSDRPAPPVSRRAMLAFIIVAALLLAAMLTLRITVEKMQLSFRKTPVEPRLPLTNIPGILGPWVQVTVDEALSGDMEHELGASQYVFRNYVDTRLVPTKMRQQFINANPEQREKLMRTLEKPLDSKATVRFAVTYYTGSADTVPHVPDRCFAADGFKSSTHDILRWSMLPRSGGLEATDVRLINFIDQIDSRNSRPTQVAYFFQVNGAYEHDPVFGVRARLQSLLEPRAYFAKIEIVSWLPDAPAAALVMNDFLTHAMHDVERVLPDIKQFQPGG
jgi:hypothetical protein